MRHSKIKQFALLSGLFLMLAKMSFSQHQGFFNVYNNSEKSLIPIAAIETCDGGFIVSAFDSYQSSYGELIKISDEGELVKRISISPVMLSSYIYSYIDFICQDPDNPDLYIALGCAYSYGQEIEKSFIAYFDEELNDFSVKIIDLPDEYQSAAYISRQPTNDNKFLCAYNIVEREKRIYMIINQDGEIEKLAEDTVTQNTDMFPTIGVFFEYPEGNRYGHYRTSYYCPPSPRLTTRLFTFDENFNPETVLEYTTFSDTVNGLITHYSPRTMDIMTAKPLNDTTMLFCDQFRQTHGPNGDNSTLLFKTDLNGNIGDFLVIGSWNDSTDRPAFIQSFDYVQDDTVSNRSIFVCCGTTKRTYYTDDDPNPIKIYKVDENFDIDWHKSYRYLHHGLIPMNIVATQDGGCLVVGSTLKNEQYNIFALKLDSEGMVNTNEISVTNELVFYPNPVKDVLQIRYPAEAKPCQIDLYDLRGHLMRSQSKGLESISMEDLPAGTYTIRVTLEGGKMYSDKVVKE